MRVLPAGAVGGALAVALAVALSPLGPIGAARTAEPPARRVPRSAAPRGRARSATAALFVLAAFLPARRASRSARAIESASRRSATVDFLARSGLSPSSVSGVRMALAPGEGRASVPVRTTLVSATVGIAAVAVALTITASAERLLNTPRLYGHNWDAVIGGGTHPTIPDRVIARLRADPSVTQLSIGAVAEGRVGGKPIGLLAMDAVRGALAPTLLDGTCSGCYRRDPARHKNRPGARCRDRRPGERAHRRPRACASRGRDAACSPTSAPQRHGPSRSVGAVR